MSVENHIKYSKIPAGPLIDEKVKPFIVEPVITYRVKKEVEELDFTEKYVSLLDE